MNKILISTLNRTRYLLAGLLILGVQLLPFGSFWLGNIASATDTATLIASGQGTYKAWENGVSTINEDDKPSCSSSDSIKAGISAGDNDNDNNARESFKFNLSSIPTGSTINSVTIEVTHVGDSEAGGTFQTFARLNDSNTDSETDIVATGTDTTCSQVSQNIDVTDAVKSQDTTFEAGVIKTGTSAPATNKIRIGSIRAIVSYTAQKSTPVAATNYTPQTPNPTPNPSLTQACGLDIALVMDNSNSINSTEMTQMKNAMKGFTNALNGTPTQFSLTRFGTTASVPQTFTDSISSINTAIDSITATGSEYDSSGATNWEDGLLKAKGTFDPRTDKPNLVIFASDGNPTKRNNPDGPGTIGTGNSDVDGENLAAGVTQANSIKSSGTRILALGIGNELSTDNLKAISGNQINTGNVLTSDVITSEFSTLASDLAEFARQTCGGTITIQKTIDQDGNIQTTNDQSDGKNWQFDITGPNTNKSGTTDNDGKTSAIKVNPGTYTVTETSKTGYTIVTGSCKINSQTVGQFDANSQSVKNIAISGNDIVTCRFYNRPSTGTLVVNKVVNGGPSAGHPEHFSFNTLNANHTFEADGSNAITGLSENTPYSVTENNIPTNYQASYSSGCSGQIVATQTKTCTITNTYVNPPELTVTKTVVNNNGGTKTAKEFKLFLNGSQLTGPVGNGLTTTYTKTLTTGQSYTVTEENTLPAYANTYLNCYDISYGKVLIEKPFIAQGNKKYLCEVGNDDVAPKLTVVKKVNNQWGGGLGEFDFSLLVNGGQVTSGVSNSFNAGSALVNEQQRSGYAQESIDCGEAGKTGSFTMALGGIYKCTITNKDLPGKLIVKKTVVNDNGGTKEAKNFSFNVSGKQGTYTFNKDGINEILVANGTYTVTEVTDPGYQTTYSNCSNLKIPNGVTVTCNITNDDKPASLTITKDTNMESSQEFDFSSSLGSFSLKSGDNHKFENISAGTTVTVNENNIDGWKLDDVECYGAGEEGWSWNVEGLSVDLSNGDNVNCIFSNRKLGSVNGYKFNDANANGQLDENEQKLANWTITITNICDTTEVIQRLTVASKHYSECVEITQQTKTDSTGKYSFINLANGKYKVCEVQQSGWTQTYPTSVCHTVEISRSNDLPDVNFGNHKQPEGGAVLGDSTIKPTTTAPVKLVNTGYSSQLNVLVTAFVLVGLTSLTALFTRHQKN